jgi:L-malate glycosyltransferase
MPDKPLRILLVVDSLYPGNGGTEAQAQLLSVELTRAGHEVTVVAPHWDKSRPLRERIAGIPVERIPYPGISLLGAVILMFRFAAYLIRRRGQYDAVHIHMAKNLAAAAGFVRSLIGVPVLVKISGAWEFDGGVLDMNSPRAPIFALLRSGLRRVDYFQVISRYTRERLLDAGFDPKQVLMIPNAVDVDKFDRASSENSASHDAPTVIYLGRLQFVKGVDVLLRAWPQVLARSSAQLLLAGEGAFREKLEQLASELGIADRVRFLGKTSEVAELLARGDLLVQPSRQEGLPNSVLEAMAARLPVVATRVSGNEDLVVDGVTGRLVPSEAPADLAEAVVTLLQDRSQAERMGSAGRRIIDERFQVSTVIAQLVAAYRGVPLPMSRA